MTDQILSQWSRLGVMFNVAAAEDTPDLERLLILTAAVLPDNPRLLSTTVTWLCLYYRFICKHRLAAFAFRESSAETLAGLGLMLEFVKKEIRTDHFNLAIDRCRPVEIPKPLFAVDRQTEKLAALAKKQSCELSAKWGLWCSKIQIKKDAVRPLDWIMQANPSLKQRAIFDGNLKASILETLFHDRLAGQSESLLSRYCCATRKAVRESLDHLEFCGMIERKAVGRKVQIRLCLQ